MINIRSNAIRYLVSHTIDLSDILSNVSPESQIEPLLINCNPQVSPDSIVSWNIRSYSVAGKSDNADKCAIWQLLQKEPWKGPITIHCTLQSIECDLFAFNAHRENLFTLECVFRQHQDEWNKNIDMFDRIAYWCNCCVNLAFELNAERVEVEDPLGGLPVVLWDRRDS